MVKIRRDLQSFLTDVQLRQHKKALIADLQSRLANTRELKAQFLETRASVLEGLGRAAEDYRMVTTNKFAFNANKIQRAKGSVAYHSDNFHFIQDKVFEKLRRHLGVVAKDSPKKRAFSNIATHLLTSQHPSQHSASNMLSGHQGGVLSLAVSPDEALLASASADCTVRIWDIEQMSCREVCRQHKDSVSSVIWISTTHLASGDYSNNIKIWDLSSPSSLSLKGHDFTVQALTLIPDMSMICSASSDETIRCWDLRSQKCVFSLAGHTGSVYCLSYCLGEQHLCSGSADSTVKVWDLRRRAQLASLNGHSSSVMGVSWHQSERRLASVGTDSNLMVWDLTTMRSEVKVAQRSRGLESVASCTGTKNIATGSADSTIGVWSVASDKQEGAIAQHQDKVLSLTWRASCKELLSGGRDTKILKHRLR
jgi:WD40 repeat protein